MLESYQEGVQEMVSKLGLAAGLVLILAACGAPAPGSDGGSAGGGASRDLVVYAASSLTEAFGAIGAIYEKEHPGSVVRFSFESSSTLASQIVEGGPADVFASADKVQMGVVRKEGLARDPMPFVTNRLVVITPRGNPRDLESPGDVARRGVKLVLGAPEVPVGAYAREMFGRMGLLEEAEANVVSNEEDVKAVVAKVRLGEADAGVVYRTDVTSEIQDDLHVIEVPKQHSPLAVYPITVLAGAPNPGGAWDFVELVTSKAGTRVLQRYGFGLP